MIFRLCQGLNLCSVFVQSFIILLNSLCSSILIVDPSSEEESLSTAQLTVVTDEGDRLCAVHKPGQKKSRLVNQDIMSKSHGFYKVPVIGPWYNIYCSIKKKCKDLKKEQFAFI